MGKLALILALFAGNDPTNMTKNYEKTSVRVNAARYDVTNGDLDGMLGDLHLSGTWSWDLIVEACVWCMMHGARE